MKHKSHSKVKHHIERSKHHSEKAKMHAEHASKAMAAMHKGEPKVRMKKGSKL